MSKRFDAFIELVKNGWTIDAAKTVVRAGEGFLEESDGVKTTLSNDYYEQVGKVYGLKIDRELCFPRGRKSEKKKIECLLRRALVATHHYDIDELRTVTEPYQYDLEELLREGELFRASDFWIKTSEDHLQWLLDHCFIKELNPFLKYGKTIDFLIGSSKTYYSHYFQEPKWKAKTKALRSIGLEEELILELQTELLQPETHKDFYVRDGKPFCIVNTRKILEEFFQERSIDYEISDLDLKLEWCRVFPPKLQNHLPIARCFFDLNVGLIEPFEYPATKSMEGEKGKDPRSNYASQTWTDIYVRLFGLPSANFKQVQEYIIPIAQYTGCLWLLGSYLAQTELNW